MGLLIVILCLFAVAVALCLAAIVLTARRGKKRKAAGASRGSNGAGGQARDKWTAVCSDRSHQTVAAYRDGLIFFYHERRAAWYECGKCVNGNVYNTYNDPALTGRVEAINGRYHCILDFRERKASTIGWYKDRIREHPEFDHRSDLEKIKALERHPDELDVGYVKNGAVWFHESPVGGTAPPAGLSGRSSLYAEPNDEMELAAVFVCLQSIGDAVIDDADKPFSSLYP